MERIACSIDLVKILSATDIKALLDANKVGEYVVLEVRQPKGYNASHMPGAVLMSHELALKERRHAGVLLGRKAELVRR